MLWLLFAACGVEQHQVPRAEPVVTVTPVADAAPPPSKRTYEVEVSSAQKRLAIFNKRVEARPTAYEALLDLSDGRLTLQRLRGGLDDGLAARDAYELARDAAPEGHARTRRVGAKVLAAEHRFSDALVLIKDLDTPGDRIQRASIRFQLGEYEDAVKVLATEIAALDRPNPSAHATLAGCLWKLGRFEEAEAELEKAMATYHGRDQWVSAWHHLMLGLMDLDQKKLPEAMKHYEEADRALPGWWLVTEHQAEVLVGLGKAEAAVPLYERVVAETKSPELMGALADALAEVGRADEAKRWRAKALAGFEEQLKRSPTSAGGHALDFFLAHAPDRALTLAKANVALRPNGEAKLQLAEALKQAGQGEEAAALRKEVEASGWWIAPE